MEDKYKSIIKDEIAPLLQNGDLALFLGAGISIGTDTVNGLGVPSTQELIHRICEEAGYGEEASSTDLPTAFGVGVDEIDNFDNFLISNFDITKTSDWQMSIFRYWWRCIFTTNIDTLPEVSINELANGTRDYPDYKIFNYRDREPVQTIPTSPPVVYLHGNVKNVNEGFVFDSVSYADNTVKHSDWINKCALHISHGNCLFVGSKFKESDIEAAIREREIWDVTSDIKKTNWIVLRTFSKIEKKSYEKRGIVPIEATAEDFFTYLFSQVAYLSPHKFIRRKAPYLLANIGTKSASWFSKNMENITMSLDEAKRKKGPFSRFYLGDMPDWFYIINDVPAVFTKTKEIEKRILEFEKSEEKALVIAVTGPLGTGKTTSVMSASASLAKTHSNIYMYSGIDGIDINHTWNVIKDLKGLVLIVVDAASGHFYAINELMERVLDRSTSCKLCFLAEERTIYYERNRRHFSKIPETSQDNYEIGTLDKVAAGTLYDKSIQLGIKFEKLEGKNRDESIEQIVNFDYGYKGDLLATLYDLSFRKSYKEKLSEEYMEISGAVARKIYQTISLVTASRLSIPVNYLAESHSMSVNSLAKILQGELKGKIHSNGRSMTVSARHHSIAEFHISNNFEKESIKSNIIDLMKCLSTKFTIQDIKQHPISYKIYSKMLSFHYLTEILFKGKHFYHYIHDIYSTCQSYFSQDGVFWLQYGRFLERDGDLEGGLHCFRKGLGLYDSFQIRHALGQLLLKKYRVDGCVNIDDYNDGITFLSNEISLRGAFDPYPYTALGNELIKIIKFSDGGEMYINTLKDIINRGINIHNEDKKFLEMVKRYVKITNNKIEII